LSAGDAAAAAAAGIGSALSFLVSASNPKRELRTRRQNNDIGGIFKNII